MKGTTVEGSAHGAFELPRRRQVRAQSYRSELARLFLKPTCPYRSSFDRVSDETARLSGKTPRNVKRRALSI